MVYSLTYRRPSLVASSQNSVNAGDKDGSIDSCSSCMSHGIPEALSFDRILSGGTCPPVTTRDFLNYLKYIEHSAENLQFFLWFKDYQARWEQLPDSEKVLAPEWTHAQHEVEAAAPRPVTNPAVSDILKNTGFADSDPKVDVSERGDSDPFDTPPRSPGLQQQQQQEHYNDDGRPSDVYAPSNGDRNTFDSNANSGAPTSFTAKAVAEQAFEDAGLKWKPFTTQPYRDEINRIIAIYIADNSPRQLNLSHRDRQAVFHALQNTTHPSALRSVATTVEYSLRHQAHPNFIRWSICNGNRPRVIFARGLGTAGIIVGLIADLLITLSSAGRAWRVLPFIGWFIGISTLIAAWKGMCVVLHGMHHRHLRPWELFADETDELSVINEKGISQDSLQSNSTNSYEDEPWVARYKKRNVIRKIFDRELWVQEPALRQIQDTIFLQAILGAFLLSCLFVGIFCAVPHGNFY
ncbi:hypothetical protein K431DRAFT_245546 [Polychaeton citri CBS 116435]|uniref:RGS domain-containing protein n=1 Tax=Polychaeton citri CBS 116435 TaxID=1314669 RepID=A0A9P4UQX0_9PEZI|nr:hypothetical protein K431DRAFT_245546 [Polychaeton citri CBS 116435]